MCDDTADMPESRQLIDGFAKFKKELAALINKHSLENMLEMPDFMIAELFVNILRAMNVAHAQNNSWHGMQAYPNDYHDLLNRDSK